jgi:hypothetical protein
MPKGKSDEKGVKNKKCGKLVHVMNVNVYIKLSCTVK